MRLVDLNHAGFSVRAELVEALRLRWGEVSILCTASGCAPDSAVTFLCFAKEKSPKERRPRFLGPGNTGAALRCSREPGSAELARVRAQTTALLDPPPAALLSSSQGGPKSQYISARCASPGLRKWGSPQFFAQPNERSAGVGSWGPRWRRPAAQGKTDQEVQMFEPAGRVSELPGLTEQRRAVPVPRDRRIRGRLWCVRNLASPSEHTPSSRPFGDFSLAKQRKVTVLSGTHPDAVQRNERVSSNTAQRAKASAGGRA
jgi:hypothetical protein